MNYRLALKLGLEQPADLSRAHLGGKAAIGWAVIALDAGDKSAGVNHLPEIDKLKKKDKLEVRVVVYDEPSQMIEPMSLIEYEARLSEVTKDLPEGAEIIRVKFDERSFSKFLKKKKLKDSHKTRALWANR